MTAAKIMIAKRAANYDISVFGINHPHHGNRNAIAVLHGVI